MKTKTFTVIGLAVALLISPGVRAQTTVNLTTAGTLQYQPGMASVQKLILTGPIDVRDMKFICDNMPVTELDLSGAHVVSYSGPEGSHSVNTILSEIFKGKTDLTSVKLPAGLTSIGAAAFSFCSSLTDISLPEGLTSIGNMVFASYSGLTSVTSLSFTPQGINDNVFESVTIGSIPLKVPYSAVDAYEGKAVWKDFSIIIGMATVIFESNGGSPVEQQFIAEGSKIAQPAAPTRTGYNFEGWYKDAALTAAWDFASDKVTADTTLYAAWLIKRYTVTFVSNGGSSVGRQTVDFSGTVAEPAAPTRTGYTFEGWYREGRLTATWNFATGTVTESMTLYAKWGEQRLPTGVERQTPGVAGVYPNPTSGEVTVENGGAEVRLYSLSGGLLKRVSGNRLDLSGYPGGVYLLRAGRKTVKVVKR
jgi:uncharacterized repeat protein (TIGR02543 family)